jgi:DNA repair exonuclease SbcCD nuclease subunit
MTLSFIHTADWQIGKPFASIEDPDNRSKLASFRVQVIHQIAQLCTEHQAAFVLVAGDLWDSITPTKKLVSETLAAIGKIPVPVYVIPGNHDHGAMGSIWHQPFFLEEKEALSPNLQVILTSEPLDLGEAILLPCPLLRRHEHTDLSQWLREGSEVYDSLSQKPRIVLAHGSVISFGSTTFEDEEELGYGAANFIDLSRFPMEQLDYIGLGDWHGTKQITDKTWYSGTPEPDRFPKSNSHNQGNVLLVKAERGANPTVTPIKTAKLSWNKEEFHFTGDDSLDAFESVLHASLGTRVGMDLLHLSLTGSLGLEYFSNLQKKLETYQNRLLRIKLDNQVKVDPSMDELDSLLQSTVDPLIARVAENLVVIIERGGDEGEIAREALKQLYFTTKAI